MSHQSPRVLVIGAGFGGLGVAAELRRQGIDDVTILERAKSVGGVWRDNTYPGAACDVPSALYSWSWAVNASWGRRYSTRSEILAYLRNAAEREGLLGLVRTGCEVTDVVLDEPSSTWRVLGLSVPGFPNLFCIYGPNTNLGGSSIIAMMEAQAGYIAQVARRIADSAARSVGVRREVADAFDEEMQSRLSTSAWSGCTSWYTDGGRVTTNWPGLVGEYQQRTAEVDWSELEVTG